MIELTLPHFERTKKTHGIVFKTCLLLLFSPLLAAKGELPKLPTYALDKTRNCGPVCLKFLDEYFGGTKSYLDVADICTPTRDGTSFSQLQNAIKQMGYYSIPFQANPKQLKSLRFPAILHLKFKTKDDIQKKGALDHFVVYLGWNKEKSVFRLFDPALGMTEYSMSKMPHYFSGVGSAVSDSPLPSAETLFLPETSWGKVAVLFISLFTVVFGLMFARPIHLVKRCLLSAKGHLATKANMFFLLFVGCSSLLLNGCRQISGESEQKVEGVQTVDVGTHFTGDPIHHVFKVYNPSKEKLQFLGKEST